MARRSSSSTQLALADAAPADGVEVVLVDQAPQRPLPVGWLR
jgi:hypothetical protein